MQLGVFGRGALLPIGIDELHKSYVVLMALQTEPSVFCGLCLTRNLCPEYTVLAASFLKSQGLGAPCLDG